MRKKVSLSAVWQEATLGELTSRQVGEGGGDDCQPDKRWFLGKVKNCSMKRIVVRLILRVASAKH